MYESSLLLVQLYNCVQNELKYDMLDVMDVIQFLGQVQDASCASPNGRPWQ